MFDKLKILVAGLGNRGLDTYLSELKKYPEEVEIVGIADPLVDRLEKGRKLYNIDEKMCFKTAEEMFSNRIDADIAIIATPDRLHVKQSIMALENGYDILLEKPISPDIDECKKITELANRLNRKVVLCHVLRYTYFYRKIKEYIDEGRIGDIVNIMAIENVGYFHQAHSFVRGNWRNSVESSPMILQKCCHDTDILTWLSGQRAKRISSFGSTNLFKKEKSPQDKVKRCFDGCPVKDRCVYDAEKIYITNKKTGIAHGNTGWPNSVLTVNPNMDTVREALVNGPYGRCVYFCDNDVVDHQVVNMEMENNSTISLTMTAFSAVTSRYLKVMGTLGEIEGDMEKNIINLRVFGEEDSIIDLNKMQINLSGHGGGDEKLVREFLDYIKNDIDVEKTGITSIDISTESHYIAFAAEESRLHGGIVVDMDRYRDLVK